jgi:hypothetical protein
MGASSDQIDREIRETRSQLDQKLGILERRAASGARRYGRVVAGVAVGILAVTIGAIAYRRRRRQAAVKQLRDLLFESVRDLPDEVTSRLKRRLPIKVVVTDGAHEESAPSAWTGIARKVAPAVAGSATGAVVSRLVRRTPPNVPESE